MDLKSHTLDGPGRGYLVGRLRDRGYSLDMADRAVRMVFDEMSQALRRGENVDFPFGYLKAVGRRRSEAPLTIEHVLDVQGRKLLDGEKAIPIPANWSLAHGTEPVKKPERGVSRQTPQPPATPSSR